MKRRLLLNILVLGSIANVTSVKKSRLGARFSRGSNEATTSTPNNTTQDPCLCVAMECSTGSYTADFQNFGKWCFTAGNCNGMNKKSTQRCPGNYWAEDVDGAIPQAWPPGPWDADAVDSDTGTVSDNTWQQLVSYSGVRGSKSMCFEGDTSSFEYSVEIVKGLYHQIGVATSDCCKNTSTGTSNSADNFAALSSGKDGWDSDRGAATPVGTPTPAEWWSGTWNDASKTMDVTVNCAKRQFTIGIQGGDSHLGTMSWPSHWVSVYPFFGGQSADHEVNLVAAPQQASTTKQTTNTTTTTTTTACPQPPVALTLPAKTCPSDEGCLNFNQAYSTFGDAWIACGSFTDCSFISLWVDDQYYLRRVTDPDMPDKANRTMAYCRIAPIPTTTLAAGLPALLIYDESGAEKRRMTYNSEMSRFTDDVDQDYFFEFSDPRVAVEFLTGSLNRSVDMVQGGGDSSKTSGLMLQPNGDISTSGGFVPFLPSAATWKLINPQGNSAKKTTEAGNTTDKTTKAEAITTTTEPTTLEIAEGTTTNPTWEKEVSQSLRKQIELESKKEKAPTDTDNIALDNAFDRLDTNYNGKLSRTEFLAGLSPDDSSLSGDKLFEAIDKDRDGDISHREFLLAAKASESFVALSEPFQKADVDGNGFLSKDEFIYDARQFYPTTWGDSGLMSAINEIVIPLFRLLDTNHDGRLSRREFLKQGDGGPELVSTEPEEEPSYERWPKRDSDQTLIKRAKALAEAAFRKAVSQGETVEEAAQASADAAADKAYRDAIDAGLSPEEAARLGAEAAAKAAFEESAYASKRPQLQHSKTYTLLYKDLDYGAVDRKAFEEGLRQQILLAGAKQEKIDKLVIALSEGFIVGGISADLTGPDSLIAQIESFWMTDLEVMGCIPTCSKAGESCPGDKQPITKEGSQSSGSASAEANATATAGAQEAYEHAISSGLRHDDAVEHAAKAASEEAAQKAKVGGASAEEIAAAAGKAAHAAARLLNVSTGAAAKLAASEAGRIASEQARDTGASWESQAEAAAAAAHQAAEAAGLQGEDAARLAPLAAGAAAAEAHVSKGSHPDIVAEKSGWAAHQAALKRGLAANTSAAIAAEAAGKAAADHLSSQGASANVLTKKVHEAAEKAAIAAGLPDDEATKHAAKVSSSGLSQSPGEVALKAFAAAREKGVSDEDAGRVGASAAGRAAASAALAEGNITEAADLAAKAVLSAGVVLKLGENETRQVATFAAGEAASAVLQAQGVDWKVSAAAASEAATRWANSLNLTKGDAVTAAAEAAGHAATVALVAKSTPAALAEAVALTTKEAAEAAGATPTDAAKVVVVATSHAITLASRARNISETQSKSMAKRLSTKAGVDLGLTNAQADAVSRQAESTGAHKTVSPIGIEGSTWGDTGEAAGAKTLPVPGPVPATPQYIDSPTAASASGGIPTQQQGLYNSITTDAKEVRTVTRAPQDIYSGSGLTGGATKTQTVQTQPQVIYKGISPWHEKGDGWWQVRALGTGPCETPKPGDQCWATVQFAMTEGIRKHPSWYPGLTSDSSFPEFQARVYMMGNDDCLEPCSFDEADASTASAGTSTVPDGSVGLAAESEVRNVVKADTAVAASAPGLSLDDVWRAEAAIPDDVSTSAAEASSTDGAPEKDDFAELDLNGDGKLSQSEISRWKPADEFSTLDTNGDGHLSPDELAHWGLSQQQDSDSVGAVAAGASTISALSTTSPDPFDSLDTNHDGKLTPDELSQQQSQDTFGMLDANHDGKLSAEELKQWQQLTSGDSVSDREVADQLSPNGVQIV